MKNKKINQDIKDLIVKHNLKYKDIALKCNYTNYQTLRSILNKTINEADKQHIINAINDLIKSAKKST